jgi:hypothetical protein
MKQNPGKNSIFVCTVIRLNVQPVEKDCNPYRSGIVYRQCGPVAGTPGK